MRNQKGFAATEIILIMLIISTLTGIVVPKMTRIIDTATLDYETKKFRSEFLFAQSLSRSATYEPTIFSSSPISKGTPITFKTAPSGYKIERNGNLIREENLLSNGFKINCPNNLRDVSLSSSGKSGKTGSYIFVSPLNNERYLKLDSVGRLRIDRAD